MVKRNWVWLMLGTRVKLRTFAIVVGMFCAMTVSFNVKAFRPNTRPWLNNNTTYSKTAALTGQPGFATATDTAAANWSSQTMFTYIIDASSDNRVDYRRPDAPYQNILMVTYSWWGSDVYRDKIEIVVNTQTDSIGVIPWHTGSGTPPPNYYSFQTIMTHEMGHGAGLGHVPGTSVMKSSFGPQEVRSITQDERDGIRFLYDSANSNFHPAGQEPWGAQGGFQDNPSKYIGYTGQSWVFSLLPFGQWPNGSTLAWSNSPGSKAWGEFNGSTLTWEFTKHYLRGPAEVYIDGTLQTTINLYSADTVWRAKKTWDVTPGNHVIEVRHTGGSGQYIDVDSFDASKTIYGAGTYDNNHAGIEYPGYWTFSTCCPSAYNGTLSWSNTRFDNATFTFRGDGVTYYYTKANNRGIAGIYIDGVFIEELDLYSAAIQWQQSKRWALAQGPHTINVVVTRRKNASAAEYYVDVDRFVPD
jgi:hypothetical protein